MTAAHTCVFWMAPWFNHQPSINIGKLVSWFFLVTIFHPSEINLTSTLYMQDSHSQNGKKCYYFHLSFSLGGVRDGIHRVNRSRGCAEEANRAFAALREASAVTHPGTSQPWQDYSVSAGAIESGAAFPFNSPLIRSPASNWLPNFSISRFFFPKTTSQYDSLICWSDGWGDALCTKHKNWNGKKEIKSPLENFRSLIFRRLASVAGWQDLSCACNRLCLTLHTQSSTSLFVCLNGLIVVWIPSLAEH